jgi:D-alanyl-lipoteichoic acid acyltransferase DltB (MBOAT superfamily)
LFNSWEFGVFLLLVVGVYFGVLPESYARTRKAFLLAASYLFYAAYNPAFTVLLLFSTAVDYVLAGRMVRAVTPGYRRFLLLISLFVNLGLLGVFKYGAFLVESFHALIGVHFGMARPGIEIFLPVGISFYTFQTLSYTIDVYRGRLEPCRNLLDFALYVSFFPQLVAGPIVRAVQFLPQLGHLHNPSEQRVEYGILRIAIGLVKKIFLADVLGAYVDVVFGTPVHFGAGNLLLAIYAYAYQIYFDFSAYSDIAIGLGAIFGLTIPENFDRPYLSTSPREFWKRWHITLSTWLRDYLYISLGGNRFGQWATMRNLMITMLLGGLWHGAAWTFVAWGAYHGLLLVAQHAAENRGWHAPFELPVWLRRVITFHLVVLGWVVFRAASFADAVTILHGLGTWRWSGWLVANQALFTLAVAISIHVAPKSEHWHRRFLKLRPEAQGLLYGAAAAALLAVAGGGGRFIYFQF